MDKLWDLWIYIVSFLFYRCHVCLYIIPGYILPDGRVSSLQHTVSSHSSHLAWVFLPYNGRCVSHIAYNHVVSIQLLMHLNLKFKGNGVARTPHFTLKHTQLFWQSFCGHFLCSENPIHQHLLCVWRCVSQHVFQVSILCGPIQFSGPHFVCGVKDTGHLW